MGSLSNSMDNSWWLFTVPAIVENQNLFNGWVIVSTLLACLSLVVLTWLFFSGGPAWKNGRNYIGLVPITGPRGLPLFGSLFTLSHGLAHRTLACMAASLGATDVMAFSLGSTPAVVTSKPHIAREILSSPHFADRPIMQSAKSLMFSRAIGFAPNGTYWRLLRRIASTHLFSPKRIAAHEAGRQSDCDAMLDAISDEQFTNGFVNLRKHLQCSALNNITGTVFGKRYNLGIDIDEEAKELHEIVREGFDILGAFNLSDHIPWLSIFYDPFHIHKRCSALVPRVRKFVSQLIDEHNEIGQTRRPSDTSDFVDVLLSLDGEEKLNEDDMIAVLWEMIFRGTDTVALLTEWAMAELVLNQQVQAKVQQELDTVVGTHGDITDALVSKLPYLQAVVKETLRIHPPGPLLSWARLSTSNVQLSNGMVIPANTTAMVNMWAITNDPSVWEDPLTFKPERFVKAEGGVEVDVRGGDLRLAPFGAGRRVCPGKTLGLVTVTLWVAKLVHHFKWVQDSANPVDLTEVLKLSCEMKNPLRPVAIPRRAA